MQLEKRNLKGHKSDFWYKWYKLPHTHFALSLKSKVFSAGNWLKQGEIIVTGCTYVFFIFITRCFFYTTLHLTLIDLISPFIFIIYLFLVLFWATICFFFQWPSVFSSMYWDKNENSCNCTKMWKKNIDNLGNVSPKSQKIALSFLFFQKLMLEWTVHSP